MQQWTEMGYEDALCNDKSTAIFLFKWVTVSMSCRKESHSSPSSALFLGIFDLAPSDFSNFVRRGLLKACFPLVDFCRTKRLFFATKTVVNGKHRAKRHKSE